MQIFFVVCTCGLVKYLSSPPNSSYTPPPSPSTTHLLADNIPQGNATGTTGLGIPRGKVIN